MDEPASFETRVTEWADWFVFNHDRLALYYRQGDPRQERYTFAVTMIDGLYELAGWIAQRINDRWHEEYECAMPQDIVRQLQQDVVWFYQHRGTISDPDIQYEFVTRALGKALQALRNLGQELHHLEIGTVQSRDFEALAQEWGDHERV